MTSPVPSRQTKVVVVDDSMLMRTMLASAIEAEGDLKVVGSAADPYEARDVIKASNPDVITLDVEMPGMNGLEFLNKIMTLRPTPVVMVSSLTSEGAEATLTALELGAVDFAAKPAGGGGMSQFGELVRRKVRSASGARVRKRVTAAPPTQKAAAVGGDGQLIAIGASTGGVAAIGQVVSSLPKGLPPIVCVVHMPEKYTGRFAARLAQQSGLDIAEAREGEALARGMMRIAPGDNHVEVAKSDGGYVTRLTSGAPVSGHRPSVDVCFNSVASAAGARAIGVILTGMGRDGAQGLLKMRQQGALCLGEAESSCVVYGMPKAARQIGAVNEEHDLDRIAARICELASGATRRLNAAL